MAEMMDLPVDVVAEELAALADVDLVTYRHGRMSGHMQTPEGRVHGDRLLAEELETSGARPAIEQAYAAFRERNDELLAVCTAWQLRMVDGEQQRNDHTDADHDDRVRQRLTAVHESLQPVLAGLAEALDRFAGHGRRLGTALDRVLAGEHDYFTKPMFPSYHSTWFELHEDLLATLGNERATEGDS